MENTPQNRRGNGLTLRASQTQKERVQITLVQPSPTGRACDPWDRALSAPYGRRAAIQRGAYDIQKRMLWSMGRNGIDVRRLFVDERRWRRRLLRGITQHAINIGRGRCRVNDNGLYRIGCRIVPHEVLIEVEGRRNDAAQHKSQEQNPAVCLSASGHPA